MAAMSNAPRFPAIDTGGYTPYARRRKPPADASLWIIVGLVGALTFGGGYFAGREHVKWELRKTVEEIGEIFAPPDNASATAIQPRSAAPPRPTPRRATAPRRRPAPPVAEDTADQNAAHDVAEDDDAWEDVADAPTFDDALEAVYQRTAADAVRQYEMAERSGNAMDAYIRAGVAASAYLQAGDEPNYNKWQAIQKSAARRAGIPAQ